MVDVIEEVKENIEKSSEAIEEVVKEGKEAVEEVVKKIEKKSKKVIKKIIGDVIEKEDKVVKKIEGKIKKSAEKKRIKKETTEESIDEVSRKDLKETEEVQEIPKQDLVKAAEAESLDTKEAKSLEERKKEVLEKAKKLRGKIDIAKTEDLKEKVKAKKRADMLIPLEEYVKAGIYLGTKVVTPNMRPFVYRRRADGLAIFNTDLIDEKLKEGIEYLSKFAPEDVIIVCKRQAGWKVVDKFSELTGIREFTQKYPAGILTNTTLPDFFETELTIVTDSWLDKNALNDTVKVHKKVLMICDTNNFSKGADQIIIGNNKSPKSLGVIFYLLTRGYCKAKKIDADIPDLEWWTGED